MLDMFGGLDSIPSGDDQDIKIAANYVVSGSATNLSLRQARKFDSVGRN